MKIEATMTDPSCIDDLVRHGKALEEAGFDTLLVPEAGHDPFLPAMALAQCTSKPRLGTGVAIAFPRSPFVTAQLCWDLQRFSHGRFVLGLGTQVKGHNERRYSTPWPAAPGPRLREYILCLRAIIRNFATGEVPNFEGQYYRFTLNTPFFNPGPIEGVESVPIYIAAVNPYNCRLAGELCEGLRMHPLNTPAYIRDIIRPAVAEGTARVGRAIGAIDLVANPFIIIGNTSAELAESRQLIRQHISYYAATRTYSRVLEHHGWQEIGERLVRLSQQGRWKEMPALVTDDMLAELAVTASLEELPERLTARYGGLVTSINPVFGPPYPELQQRQRRIFESLRPVVPQLKTIQ